VFDTIVEGLTTLDASAVESDAFRMVIMDLDPPLIRWGVAESLDDRLRGSPAGAALGRMRTHAQDLANRRVRRMETETPAAKAARRETRRQQHLKRSEAGLERRDRRHELLSRLRSMSDEERLAWLAGREPGFPLEMFPDDLVPATVEADRLTIQQAHRLVRLIDRRRGAWGRLARRLAGLL
jgi:hypothetical protein